MSIHICHRRQFVHLNCKHSHQIIFIYRQKENPLCKKSMLATFSLETAETCAKHQNSYKMFIKFLENQTTISITSIVFIQECSTQGDSNLTLMQILKQRLHIKIHDQNSANIISSSAAMELNLYIWPNSCTSRVRQKHICQSGFSCDSHPP